MTGRWTTTDGDRRLVASRGRSRVATFHAGAASRPVRDLPAARRRNRRIAANDRSDSGVPVRRAGAGRRPADADVAGRLELLPSRRARRADGDNPHRIAWHVARVAAGDTRRHPRGTPARSAVARQLGGAADPRRVAVRELAGLGVNLRWDLWSRSTRWNAGDRLPLDRVRREARRRSARRNACRTHRSAARGGRAVAVVAELRLLATGETGVLVDRAVPIRHQCAGVSGAGAG